MNVDEAIKELDEMQSQIIHGTKIFGEMANIIRGLKSVSDKQHSMLRAFRYSMDSNLPFPSRDKLDEILDE